MTHGRVAVGCLHNYKKQEIPVRSRVEVRYCTGLCKVWNGQHSRSRSMRKEFIGWVDRTEKFIWQGIASTWVALEPTMYFCGAQHPAPSSGNGRKGKVLTA